MDCRTGKIHQLSEDELNKTDPELKKHLAPIVDESSETVKRMSKPKRISWMRNKSCPCGSEKKFKKCCWDKYV